MPIDENILGHFVGRIDLLPSGKLHITKFILFQYGKLSRGCKPHMPVFAALEKHGIAPDGVTQNEAFRETVDDSLRQKIITRDGLVCTYYGTTLKAEEVVIDHVIPRAHGGTATMDNLVVASAAANKKKWDYSPEQFCKAAGLDWDGVSVRLSKATGKPINAFHDNPNTLLGRVKEKEKEKDEEKEKVMETVKATVTAKDAKPVVRIDDDDAESFWTDKHPTEIAERMIELQGRINSLHPSWTKRPHFSAKELHALHENAKAWLSVDVDDWNLLQAFMFTKVPDDWRKDPRDFFQPDNRLGLIGIGSSSILSVADKWAKMCKRHKVSTGLEANSMNVTE